MDNVTLFIATLLSEALQSIDCGAFLHLVLHLGKHGSQRHYVSNSTSRFTWMTARRPAGADRVLPQTLPDLPDANVYEFRRGSALVTTLMQATAEQ